MAKALAMPRYQSPVPSGGKSAVIGAVRGAQTLGKMVDGAENRKLKLNEALGKLRGK